MIFGIPWFFMLNSYTIINLAFHCSGKHSQIGFVKCRICLNYVWFAIIGIYEIYVIIILIEGLAASSNNYGSTASTGLIGFFLVSIILDFVQGLTFLVLTSKLANVYHGELGHDSYHHHDHKAPQQHVVYIPVGQQSNPQVQVAYVQPGQQVAYAQPG